MLTAAIALLVASVASPRQVEPLAQAPARISCQLVVSIDTSFGERWEHSADMPNMHIALKNTVFRKQYFAAYLFMAQYAMDKDGVAEIAYDLTITRPDGKPYYSAKDLKARSGPGGNGRDLILAETTVQACFEPEDPLGSYVVEVSIHDRKSGASTAARGTISLVEYREGEGFADKDVLSSWLESYCLSPEPARAIPAFGELGRLGIWKEESSVPLLSGFFLEVFSRNSWLLPDLLAKYKSFDKDTRRQILRLLADTKFDGKEFLGGLEGKDREMWTEVSGTPRFDPLNDPITEPAHLDRLWGMFFASGKFDPMQRICGALSSAPTGSKPQGKAESVLKACAASSIKEHARSHAVVGPYCKWILENPDTEAGVRKALAQVLQD